MEFHIEIERWRGRAGARSFSVLPSAHSLILSILIFDVRIYPKHFVFYNLFLFHLIYFLFLTILIFMLVCMCCCLCVMCAQNVQKTNKQTNAKPRHVTLNHQSYHISRSPASPSWQEDENAAGPGNASTVSYSKQSYLDPIDTRSLSIDPMENMKPSPNHPSFLYGDHTESMDDPNKTLTAADSPKTHDHLSSSGGGGGGGGGKELHNDYDADGNTETETKSVSSIKSNGSIQELRYFSFFYLFISIATNSWVFDVTEKWTRYHRKYVRRRDPYICIYTVCVRDVCACLCVGISNLHTIYIYCLIVFYMRTKIKLLFVHTHALHFIPVKTTTNRNSHHQPNQINWIHISICFIFFFSSVSFILISTFYLMRSMLFFDSNRSNSLRTLK